MYEWQAIFERHEIVEINGGQEEIMRRIKKSGRIDTMYGQDAVSAVIENEKKTGNMVMFQMRVAE